MNIENITIKKLELVNELAKVQNVNVISIGFNMQCKKVITKSVLYFDGTKFRLKNDGIEINIDNTNDLLLDTKENRKLLKQTLSN